MQYIPQGQIPAMRPSPLEGLGNAANTLADAIIQGRERQAVLSDYDLLPQILAQAQQLGQPGQTQTWPPPGETDEPGVPWTQQEAPDAQTVMQKSLSQMKTPQGKAAAIKMLIDHAPKPLYGYDETGNLVQKGTMPKNAEILKADPMAVEEQRQAGLEKRTVFSEDRRDEREARRQDWQAKNQSDRDAAWGARDQRRYDQANFLQQNRQAFEEKMKGVGTEKDRTSLARKEMLSLRKGVKENYNRQVGNVRKQFPPDPLNGKVDEAGIKQGLAQAQQEYEQDLDMINSAYGDVIQKYDLRLPGMAGGKGPAATANVPGGETQPRLWNNKTGKWDNVSQETYDAVKRRQAGK